MKLTILTIVFYLCSLSLTAQSQNHLHDSISTFFKEIKEATKKNEKLWNRNLYGAILLVEPQTRKVFANEPDTTGILKPDKNNFTGILPDNINIANTSINWGGKRWAMIMLPLPQDKADRINLLAHELYHSAQPDLGFTLFNPENNHLDQKEGRIFLRLELEALKSAVQSESENDLQKHLANALIFRKYRHMLYSGADTTENLLELNEGMAEYTGAIISGRNQKQMSDHLVNGINSFFDNPTFVRSFAYHTIPVYGYLLHKRDGNWNKEITVKTDLTQYFSGAFNIKILDNLKKAVESNFNNYNKKMIFQEEAEREEKIKKLMAVYKKKFIEQPHFVISFDQMNISFDPRNIQPLEDHGTVYPNIRVSDLWGVLKVENGALLSPNWDKITITNPTSIDFNKVVGDGWILELKEDYTIQKDTTTGNYKLTKK